MCWYVVVCVCVFLPENILKRLSWAKKKHFNVVFPTSLLYSHHLKLPKPHSNTPDLWRIRRAGDTTELHITQNVKNAQPSLNN